MLTRDYKDAPREAKHGGIRRKAIAVRRLQDLKILLDVAARISGTESLDEVLEGLVEMTSLAVHCDRVTFFLHDPNSGELYSRVAQGIHRREIRLGAKEGIAGAAFATGRSIIVDDAYADQRFNAKTDQETSYLTKTVLCVPLRTVKGEVIGVAQALNKLDGNVYKTRSGPA